MENTEIDNEDEYAGFGKTDIDEAFDGYRIIKLKMPDEKRGETSTELVCRLLPAMKSNATTGRWNEFYGQHYGHAGVNSRNAEKPRARPFACIQEKDFKTKKISVHCPKCDQMEKYRLKEKTLQGAIQQKNPDAGEKELNKLYQADPKLAQVGEWLKKNNCDKKFWLNVMTEKGEFGPLTLSYTTFQKLKTVLRKLRDDDKIDAFNPKNGVWLRFTRSKPPGLIVNDEVAPVMDTVEINGRSYKEIKTAPLSKEQVARALKTCPDLATECVKFLPAEKIQQLVDCTGEPSVVDEIWDGPKEEGAAQTSRSYARNDESDGDEAPAPKATEAVRLVAAATVAATSEPEDDIDAEEKAMLAKIAARRAAKAASTAAATPPPDSEASFLDRFQPSK